MLTNLTAREMAEKLANEEFSSVDLTKEYVAAIENSELAATLFNTLILENSITKGQMIDDYRQRREYTGEIPHPAFKSSNEKVLTGEENLHPLAGVPIVISDDFVTKGLVTTADLDVLSDFVPDFDSHIFYKIKAAGLPFLGKTKTGVAAVKAVQNGLIPWAICVDTAGNVEKFAAQNSGSNQVAVQFLSPNEISTFGVLSTAKELIRIALVAKNDDDANLLKQFLLDYKVAGE